MNKSRNLKALMLVIMVIVNMLSMLPLTAYGTTKSAATVYWIEDGKVYHSTSSCRTLSRSKNIKSSTLDKVPAGRRACEVCYTNTATTTNTTSQKSSNTTTKAISTIKISDNKVYGKLTNKNAKSLAGTEIVYSISGNTSKDKELYKCSNSSSRIITSVDYTSYYANGVSKISASQLFKTQEERAKKFMEKDAKLIQTIPATKTSAEKYIYESKSINKLYLVQMKRNSEEKTLQVIVSNYKR